MNHVPGASAQYGLALTKFKDDGSKHRFRYGFIGKADGDLIFGAIFLTILNLILIVISHFLLKSGWRLKT